MYNLYKLPLATMMYIRPIFLGDLYTHGDPATAATIICICCSWPMTFLLVDNRRNGRYHVLHVVLLLIVARRHYDGWSSVRREWADPFGALKTTRRNEAAPAPVGDDVVSLLGADAPEQRVLRAQQRVYRDRDQLARRGGSVEPMARFRCGSWLWLSYLFWRGASLNPGAG